MHERDYAMLAEVVKGMPLEGNVTAPYLADGIRAIVAGRLARRLAADNPRFDSDQFIRACGLEPAPHDSREETISAYEAASLEAQVDRDEVYGPRDGE